MKIRVLSVVLLMTLFLGCSSSASEVRADESGVRETTESMWVENYTDPETGVCYLIYDNMNQKGSSGGMTVRYNSDGTIMVKK